MTCDWIMQYGIENISTIVTNVLHVRKKTFFEKNTKHQGFGRQFAPILGVHFGTFMQLLWTNPKYIIGKIMVAIPKFGLFEFKSIQS
jgi:hypothetical protein